jgi:hypothetical protein
LIVVPPQFPDIAEHSKQVVWNQLLTPLRTETLDELRWYFEQVRSHPTRGLSCVNLPSDTGSRCDGTLDFKLPVSKVPDDFRGPAMPLLAQRIVGVDGIANAALIGTAEASLRNEPDAWRDWGSHAEALQHLKQLWHVLVHYGLPARSTTV